MKNLFGIITLKIKNIFNNAGPFVKRKEKAENKKKKTRNFSIGVEVGNLFTLGKVEKHPEPKKTKTVVIEKNGQKEKYEIKDHKEGFLKTLADLLPEQDPLMMVIDEE